VPKPIAFVVMPFAEKETSRVDVDVPSKVDFDALWERVYEPVLTELGYEAVRADRDVGALVVSEMIQRLAIADLVVADVTLPNANVYYEVGVRHAAKPRGCVLVSANWGRQLFDVRQMPQLRFPLPEGSIGEETMVEASKVLKSKLETLVAGTSPVFDAVPGYPDHVDLDRASAFRADVAALSQFNAEVRAVKLAPKRERRAAALAVIEHHGSSPAVRDAVVLQMIRLIRDEVGWPAVLDYVLQLPPYLAQHPLIAEQRVLAVAKSGNAALAAAELEQLIMLQETAERRGMLGGRYKQLMTESTSTSEQLRYLHRAIMNYERGNLLDLNDFYCASNLPRLYRLRARPGDSQRADEAAIVTVQACRRALALGLENEWTKSTLLGMAFYRGDVVEAEHLREAVLEEGPKAWQLSSTLNDLRVDIRHQSDPQVRHALGAVLDDLERLLAES
jgi:hypothetical protein